ncbi:MAG: hypothetical protein H7A43_05580 [Verrucomicrobia bacterium]|nr:hypothetical protein [Verrucomicrobiota bacterium]
MRRHNLVIIWIAMLTAVAGATATTIDDFEGYSDTAALQGAWTLTVGTGGRSLETTVVDAGSKSMRLEPTFNALIIAVYRFDLPAPEDWSAATSVSLRYRGQSGNTAHDLTFQIIGGDGPVITETTATNATLATTWQTLTLPLSGQSGLTNAAFLQLVMFSFDQLATPVLYIDEITRNEPTPSADLSLSAGTGLSVSEDGATDSISVSLASQPTHDVTISPVYAGTELLISPAFRTITPAGWQTSATFTVSAINDNDIEGDHSAAVSFQSASTDAAYNNLITTNLTVNITDNDVLVQPEFTSIIYNDALGAWLSPVMTYDNQQYWLEGASDPELTNWTVYAGPFPGFNGNANLYISQSPAWLSLRIRTGPLP